MQTTQQYTVFAGTMDLLTNMLNNVLAELQKWCDSYLMIPHPEKCKAMIVQRQSSSIGPIQALRLGNNNIEWTISERLLGVQVDNKLSWTDHTANVAKSFASKLSLLRRMRFLPRKQGDIAISHIRFDSVGIVQQDAFKQPGETPCKGWENCLRIAMGHKRRRCINANWMGQSGNNVQSATNRVCL